VADEVNAQEFRGGTILGPGRVDPVEVVDYDPGWRDTFALWRARLAQALRMTARRIEHVGSTAVPGLAAKPVVDIQVSVPDVDDESAFAPALEGLGLQLRYRHHGLGWRYFRPRPGLPRDVQVHVCTAGSTWERRHLLFRDYLRAHPDAAHAYADVKHRVAADHHLDRIGYNDAKGPFIDETLELAERWAEATGWRVDLP
jgi:GrpB-like predicted nucleotidyltransferase (UPF0157 family)